MENYGEQGLVTPLNLKKWYKTDKNVCDLAPQNNQRQS